MKKNNYVYGILIFILITVFIAGCAPKGKDIYYCPMHPTYISDKPGDCPICNMKLVKKETKTERRTDKRAFKNKESRHKPLSSR